MLKMFVYRNDPVFPFDLDLTHFGELTVHKVVNGYWEGYWEVTSDFDGEVKVEHFPHMTKTLWKAIWGHFRGTL